MRAQTINISYTEFQFSLIFFAFSCLLGHSSTCSAPRADLSFCLGKQAGRVMLKCTKVSYPKWWVVNKINLFLNLYTGTGNKSTLYPRNSVIGSSGRNKQQFEAVRVSTKCKQDRSTQIAGAIAKTSENITIYPGIICYTRSSVGHYVMDTRSVKLVCKN